MSKTYAEGRTGEGVVGVFGTRTFGLAFFLWGEAGVARSSSSLSDLAEGVWTLLRETFLMLDNIVSLYVIKW